MLLFSAILVSLMTIGEIIIRHSQNPYKTKNDLIISQGQRFSTVFLGNSHSFYGLRADLWPDSALNLANVSQPLAYDRVLLERYISYMPHLRRVIMQVSYTSLFDGPIEETDEWWRATNYQLYMGTELHSPVSRYGFEASNPSLFGEKLANSLGIGSAGLRCDSLGTGLGYSIECRNDDWEISGELIATGHTAVSRPEMVQRNIGNLMAIADLCESRGIELDFYAQPEWHTYLQNIDQRQLMEMRNQMRQLCAARELRFIDLIEDERFTADDFYDSDHLTFEKGAAKLTRILADTLLSTTYKL